MRSRLAVILPTLVASLPSLVWLGSEMTKAADARWGGLALALGFGFLVRDVRGGGPARLGPVLLSLSLHVGLGVAGYRTFAAGAALLALALALVPSGTRRPRPAAAIALVLMGLPVLRDLHYVGGYPLRLVSGELAAGLLRLQGLAVERVGTGILWGDSLVEVDAPCSGIAMLWTTTLLALVASAWRRLSVRRTLGTLLLVPPIVVLANVVRCSALFHLESGRIEAPAWMHDGTGLLFFGLAAGATLHLVGRRPGEVAR
ncbi:MAG: archaeosortase/exosortase family protein [Planctomycetota bacterium]